MGVRMLFSRLIVAIAVATAIAFSPRASNAQDAAQSRSAATAPPTDGAAAASPPASSTTNASLPAKAVTPAADSIAPGTIITMQNWQTYRDFMPDGMVAFFEGKYFWKMPADVQMPVGPTVIHPLPASYMDATEKYSAQVRITELPDGGLTLRGYGG